LKRQPRRDTLKERQRFCAHLRAALLKRILLTFLALRRLGFCAHLRAALLKLSISGKS
jgi:hypothetical protein